MLVVQPTQIRVCIKIHLSDTLPFQHNFFERHCTHQIGIAVVDLADHRIVVRNQQASEFHLLEPIQQHGKKNIAIHIVETPRRLIKDKHLPRRDAACDQRIHFLERHRK